MGKVRRLRQKYHLACQKSETTTPASTPVVPVVHSIPGQPVVPVQLNSDSNLFAGVTITLSDLQQTLLPPSNSSVPLGTVSEASVIGSRVGQSLKRVPKKEKRLARRDALLRKIDTVNKLKQDAKQRKKREKTKVKLNNMMPLMDALPEVISRDDPRSQAANKIKEKLKTQKKPTLSKKKRKKTFLDNFKSHMAILNHKDYKADPASAISNFILRTVHK